MKKSWIMIICVLAVLLCIIPFPKTIHYEAENETASISVRYTEYHSLLLKDRLDGTLVLTENSKSETWHIDTAVTENGKEILIASVSDAEGNLKLMSISVKDEQLIELRAEDQTVTFKKKN